MAEMAEISLDDYAACLGAQLASVVGVAMSVQMAHLSDMRGLIQDLAEATQMRFVELKQLSETIKYDDARCSSATQAVGEVSLDRVIAMVKSTAGATVDADAPLLEAGIDSLGEIELKNQLSSTRRVAECALRDVAYSATACSSAQTAAKPEPEPSSTHVVTAGAEIDAGTSYASRAVANSSEGPAAEEEGQRRHAFTVRTRKHRVLMLHGRAADGAIMERLLTALKWTTLPLDFVTVTALHPCEPIPGLYPDAIKFANGTFDWGLLLPNSPERDACVKQSIEDIEQIIAKDPNRLDGIGGICDGSLIASLVVARQPVQLTAKFLHQHVWRPMEYAAQASADRQDS